VDASLERQRLRGNTACGSNQIDTACNSDRGAPELYYRLDLRGAPGPRQLELEGELGGDLVTYILLADPAGDGAQLTSCYDYPGREFASYRLAPRLYYLVIDGRVQNAARFDLELRSSAALPSPLECVNGSIEGCLTDSEPACAVSLVDPTCLSSAVECGLAPDAYAQFCSEFAGCCAGTRDVSECLEAWRATMACE
jgi:hypothetical protein